MKIDTLLTNKVLRLLVPGILFFGAWFLFKDKFSLLDYSVNRKRCENQENVLSQDVTGVIALKFLKADSRNVRALKLVNGSDTVLCDIFYFEGSKFYDYLEVGDTIEKKPGSLELRTKRSGLDTLYTLFYGCEP